MIKTESLLYEKTYILLQNRTVKIQFKDISEKTGVPEGWIKAFNAGKMKNPSVVRVEKLYAFLTGSELNV
jgi:predicted transcriptional regulator